MASHRAGNIANLLFQGASGAVPGIVTLNPAVALGGAGVGVANAAYQNVKGHRERKAEEMAKNPGIKPGKKKSWMDAEPAKTEQLPLHTPQQQGAFNALLPKTINSLGSNQYDIEPILEKSRRIQQSRTEPAIAARFGSYEGGPSTSAFRNAITQSRQEHELNMDVLRSEHGDRQRTQDQNLLQTLLQPSFQNLYTPAQPSFGQKLAEGFVPQVGGKLLDLATQAGGQYIGNRLSQSASPANTAQAAGAPQTIAAASTPQGQAVQQAAQAATPVPQLGGAGSAAANAAKQGGLTTAGKAGLGIAGSAGLYTLGKYLERILREGQ